MCERHSHFHHLVIVQCSINACSPYPMLARSAFRTIRGCRCSAPRPVLSSAIWVVSPMTPSSSEVPSRFQTGILRSSRSVGRCITWLSMRRALGWLASRSAVASRSPTTTLGTFRLRNIIIHAFPRLRSLTLALLESSWLVWCIRSTSLLFVFLLFEGNLLRC